MNLSPYFLQTLSWVKFWKKASNKNHDYKLFEDQNYYTFVYEYPWKLKQKFWYIPKGPILKKSRNLTNNTNQSNNQDYKLDYKLELKNFLEQIIKEAKQNNICFIKIDFDDTLTKALDYKSIDDYFNYLKQSFPCLLIINKSKKIQYLQATVCDLSHQPKQDLESDNLVTFYENNQPFWSKTNQQVKRYTKKILKEFESGKYSYSFEKSDANFQAFWEIHDSTTKRQQFSTQPKEYLHQMMLEEFGTICVIYNKDNQPASVFLGVMLDGCLYYILGGNSENGMKERTQYLLQAVVIRHARLNQCNYYDMGGYSEGSGYSIFKDGYRGEFREFLGPIDLVIKPNTYKGINNCLKIFRKIRNL